MAFEGATGSWLELKRACIHRATGPDGQSVVVSCAWGLLWRSLPTPATLGADAALSLARNAMLESCARVHSGAVQEARGAEMKSETSPRALVFSFGRPERNAVSIATCRHSVMTGECVRSCVRVCV